jgi:hypothetical protein
MTLKRALFFVIPVLFARPLFAQQPPPSTSPSNNKNLTKQQRINQMMRMEEEGDLIFNKSSAFGFRISTNGYGIFYEKGKFLTPRRTRLLQFELNEIKDPKDHKEEIFNPVDQYYTYVSVGRLNNFYELKAAYGMAYLLGGKNNKNGVAVSYLWSGGLSLGMLKAYVLNASRQPAGLPYFQSTYPTIFDSLYYVNNALGLGGGWDQLKFSPGLNAKFAMRFDYGRYNQTIAAFETGVTAEYYFSKMPLMAYVPAKQLFFNAYIAIMFGKRK